MNIIFTTQYKEHRGHKITIEMMNGMWVHTIQIDENNSDHSEVMFKTPEAAFEDAKECIDILKETGTEKIES